MKIGHFISNPRNWSNRELKRAIEPLGPFKSVINVSGHEDRDKQGGYYKGYFCAEEYAISHYPSDHAKGKAFDHSIPIDLMEPLPSDLIGRYQVAFNHTVLEHAPNPFFAFEQIAKLSNDLVITVVPFRQQLHFISGQFGDYFRFSPMAMRYLHEINALDTLFESHTPSPTGIVYIVTMGTKRPELYADYPHQVPDLDALNNIAGRHSFMDSVSHVVHRALVGFGLRARQ